MELNADLSYHQILKLIRQLPKRDIVKLTHTLQSEIYEKKSMNSIQDLILKAPTWSDSDFEAYQNAKLFNRSSKNG